MSIKEAKVRVKSGSKRATLLREWTKHLAQQMAPVSCEASPPSSSMAPSSPSEGS